MRKTLMIFKLIAVVLVMCLSLPLIYSPGGDAKINDTQNFQMITSAFEIKIADLYGRLYFIGNYDAEVYRFADGCIDKLTDGAYAQWLMRDGEELYFYGQKKAAYLNLKDDGTTIEVCRPLDFCEDIWGSVYLVYKSGDYLYVFGQLDTIKINIKTGETEDFKFSWGSRCCAIVDGIAYFADWQDTISTLDLDTGEWKVVLHDFAGEGFLAVAGDALYEERAEGIVKRSLVDPEAEEELVIEGKYDLTGAAGDTLYYHDSRGRVYTYKDGVSTMLDNAKRGVVCERYLLIRKTRKRPEDAREPKNGVAYVDRVAEGTEKQSIYDSYVYVYDTLTGELTLVIFEQHGPWL